MRVWDITPSLLCRNHLLGEHGEIHGIWSVIVNGKKGYSNHPEVNRWRGHLEALNKVHSDVAVEMIRRDYVHRSVLRGGKLDIDYDYYLVKSLDTPEPLQPVSEQVKRLAGKGCRCKVRERLRNEK